MIILQSFEPEEVIARIQAALRRTATSKTVLPKFRVISDSRKVTVHGIELALTAHEYDLLYLFS